jgi:hypothetical protein
MLREKVIHEPAQEVELRLSPTSALARMMKILEAEGVTKIAARFAPLPPRSWWSPSCVTTGEGMQSGCLMKILEAERWLKGTNFREVASLQRQGGRTASVPHPGAWKVERRDA